MAARGHSAIGTGIDRCDLGPIEFVHNVYMTHSRQDIIKCLSVGRCSPLFLTLIELH